jgi:F-type H+-transporting ATPase subunit epsilon
VTTFSLELVTPERTLFTGEVESVSLRTDVGEAAFLANHERFIAALDTTVARIDGVAGGGGGEDGGGGQVRAAVHGGFIHVANNKAVILSPVAELAGEIDVERARRALDAAEAAAPAETADAGAGGAGAHGAFVDPASPAAALKRAQVRLEAAGAT